MSHSIVIVVGPNWEEALKPFDENMDVKPYPDPYSRADLERMLHHYSKGDTGPGSEARAKVARKAVLDSHGLVTGISHKELQSLFRDWSSTDIVLLEQPTSSGDRYARMTTYNPKSKWDWYSLGGRWTGYFKLKKGRFGITGRPGLQTHPAKNGYCDQCHKEDIAIEAMRNEAGEEQGARYDRAAAIIRGRTFTPWTKVLEQFPNDVAAARAEYHAQPVVKDFAHHNDFLFDDLEAYCVSREEFVSAARRGALTPFAVLMNGSWYEKGEMGWWGMVANRKPRDEWDEEFHKMFDALPGDTILSAVDVHI